MGPEDERAAARALAALTQKSRVNPGRMTRRGQQGIHFVVHQNPRQIFF